METCNKKKKKSSHKKDITGMVTGNFVPLEKGNSPRS